MGLISINGWFGLFMKRRYYLRAVCFSVIFIFFTTPINAAQEFTFIAEPAYTQEKGEWQINVTLSEPKYQHHIPTGLEASMSLEYGFSDVLQAEISSNRSNKLVATAVTAMETDYELSLSLMLVEQQRFMPQFTLAAGVVAEDSEYGYEMGLLYSYQVIEQHFIHGNFLYEALDDKDEVTANLAYAFIIDESWTLLAEVEQSKETTKYDSSGYTNTFSAGIVFDTPSEVELGLAYLVYNGDTVQDYSWQFKAAYEF